MSTAAIGAFQNLYVTPVKDGGASFWKNWTNMVLGVDQSEKFSEELQNRVKGVKNAAGEYTTNPRGIHGFGKSVSEAWEESKKLVAGRKIGDVLKSSFKDIPEEFSKLKGLKFFGKGSKLGGVFKIIGKRFPLIMNIAGLGFALPNIINAFSTPEKEGGGIIAGFLETGKEILSQSGFAAGMPIGTALIAGIPFLGGGAIVTMLGGAIGGMIGGKIVEKLVGKTFTEQQEEKKKKEEEKNAPTPVPAPTPSPIPTPTATPTPTPTPTAETSQASSVSSGNFFANPSLLNQSKYDGDIMASNIDWSQYVKQQQQQTA